MKFSLWLVSLIIFGFMFLIGLRSNAVAGSSIPLAALAGTYTDTASSQAAFCHDNLGNPIPCSSFVQGVDILESFQTQVLGEHTTDSKSNSCGLSTVVLNDLPVDAGPPFPFTGISVGTLIDYDPSTGVGDEAVSLYNGGSCNGASFNSKWRNAIWQCDAALHRIRQRQTD